MKNIILSIGILLISSTSFAQDSYKYEGEISSENDTVKIKKYSLNEVIVTGNGNKIPVSIGKTSINPMDLSQATAVITSETLKTQQTNSLSDILKNANGVYIMGTTGGYQEEIASRGFSLNSNNTFKNGIRYFNGMSIETSGLERVEFLKGSAAILFGNVSPGGILNLVTKKPKYEFGGEIGFRTGSFNTIKPTIDIYNSIGKNKKAAFRINAAYEKADSFRDYVESERFYINPSFEIKLAENTELLVETDFTKDSRTPDFGAGIINYEIVEIPRSRFLGVTWGKFDSQQFSNTITLKHYFNSKWNLNFVNGIRYYETELFSNTRPNSGTNGSVKPNGDWNRSIQRNKAKDNYLMQQLDLKGLFSTGKIEHNVLFGADIESFKTETTSFNNVSNYDTINIFENYNPANEPAIPTLTENTLTKAPINRFGIYAQDLISFTEKIKLLAGIRYSYQDTRSDVLKYSNETITNTSNYDGAFSPRVGLIYQPSKNHSLFATYSNSFDINIGQDESGSALKPSIVDQFEVGIKNKLLSDKLYLNVTAYQISNDKFYQQSLANSNSYSYIKVLTGEVRSQGIELDITGNPVKGLTMLAGYSYNETKFLNSDYYISGSQLRYNPKNTANLSTNYELTSGKLKGINIGFISTYFGERYAGRSTRTQVANDNRQLIYLQDFIQVDATLGYTYKQFRISTKLSNVFNELNYNVHDDNSLNPIAPRNYSVALNYKI
jgi:iron complex outermembrane receptor protein